MSQHQLFPELVTNKVGTCLTCKIMAGKRHILKKHMAKILKGEQLTVYTNVKSSLIKKMQVPDRIKS